MVSRSPLPLLLLTILSGLLLVLWPFPQSTFTSLALDALPSSFVASASTPRNASAAAEWGDFARIKRRTRPFSEGVVAPLRLRHLQQYQAPEPFREIFAFNSYLDTRPVLAGHSPQIAVIVALLGKPFMDWQTLVYAENPMLCWVVVKDKKGTRSYTSTTTLSALPDTHEQEVQMVGASFNCQVEGEWQGAEIYVSISPPSIPPPSDVFLPVTPLPVLDLAEHKKGHGTSAVCLPPLTGEIYAPFIADFVTYYTALGFTHFYAYILDPGPQTLEALRRVSSGPVQPIRWALHQGLKYSATYSMAPSRNLAVDPSKWDLPGVELLEDDAEWEMGDVGSGEHDVRMWYFGQAAAQQDCAFRAMKDGHRWVFNGDWDEFLALVPANARPWPPPATSSLSSPFSDWARSVERRWTWPETLSTSEASKHHVEVDVSTYGMLPASYMFVSSFACIRCTPSRSQPPPPSAAILGLESAHPSLDWAAPGFGFPLALVSPVRSETWFNQGLRSKAIVDPWAWWSTGIHYAGLGYAEWALTRGFCATEPTAAARRAAHTTKCAMDLLQSLGRNTVVVRPPPPSSNVTDPTPSEYGLGALYHFRVDKKLSLALGRFNVEAEEEGLDVIEGQEGVARLREQRVDEFQWSTQYGDDAVLVQDWTLLETMGKAMAEVIRRKQKFGARRWISMGRARRTRGSKKSDDGVGVRMLLGGAWLIVAATVVRPLWQRGQLSAKGSGRLGPK